MAAEEIDVNVIATILSITSDYQKRIRMRRINFMKHYMNQRNKKKHRTIYFWCIGALGNRLSSERRFWVQASKGTGHGWKTSECLREHSIFFARKLMLIFCERIQPLEKLYLWRNEQQFVFGIWLLMKI
jgi:hypothetical protein